MPEGDTIWRAAAALQQRLSGKIVLSASPDRIGRLVGRTLLKVEPRGKHLMMHFDDRWVLHSHMRMTGSWHLYTPGQRWRKPRHFARALLRFEDAEAVLFSAPVLELLRDPATRTGHLGPDILVDPFDIEEVLRRARASEVGPLGELLLQQRVCAGIGNIYKCESLWIQRLDPWRSQDDLDDDELGRLYQVARRLMREALAGQGPRRRAVHGRGGWPCPRCGSSVQVRAQGAQGRLTYHCPRCQVGPEASAPPGPNRGDAIHARH
jgi:endonuclease VIII